MNISQLMKKSLGMTAVAASVFVVASGLTVYYTGVTSFALLNALSMTPFWIAMGLGAVAAVGLLSVSWLFARKLAPATIATLDSNLSKEFAILKKDITEFEKKFSAAVLPAANRVKAVSAEELLSLSTLFSEHFSTVKEKIVGFEKKLALFVPSTVKQIGDDAKQAVLAVDLAVKEELTKLTQKVGKLVLNLEQTLGLAEASEPSKAPSVIEARSGAPTLIFSNRNRPSAPDDVMTPNLSTSSRLGL